MESLNRSSTFLGVTRSHLLFILLLIFANTLYGINSLTSYINNKKSMLSFVAKQMQKRIETYRLVSFNLYDNLERVERFPVVGETRLKPDIYSLEKKHYKINSIIFGQHNLTTDQLAIDLTAYLDTLWRADTQNYSMYYLNGLDNSLILVSTMPIKELSSRYKDDYFTNVIETRKNELLLQADAPKITESFSNLRQFYFLDVNYFTLRTTFNSPGNSPTVIAFDLPVDDILPTELPIQSFQLIENQYSSIDLPTSQENLSGVYTVVKWPWLIIDASLNKTPLKIQFQIPVMTLIFDLTQNNFWLLLVNFLLLGFSFNNFYFIHRQYVRPNRYIYEQLKAQQQINEEIVTHLPLGLLIYQFDTNTVIASNSLADHLMPHLNLPQIVNMEEEHQGYIQINVNNKMYEIQTICNQQNNQTFILLIRDLDKEMMVDIMLQKATKEHKNNLAARQIMIKNLGDELRSPLQTIQQLLNQFAAGHNDTSLLDALWLEANHAQQLINQITLLTTLEGPDWKPQHEIFCLSQRLDDLLRQRLFEIRRKGLFLINHNHIPPHQEFSGDIYSLEHALSMLLHYAIVSTRYGKITLSISQESQDPSLIWIELKDTNEGISQQALNSLEYPNLAKPQQDRFECISGMTLYLCNQLCQKLGGELTVQTQQNIGTRYLFSCQLQPLLATEEEHTEKLLSGIRVILLIISDDVRALITEKLNAFGATVLACDEKETHLPYNICLTDAPEHMDDNTLLLVSDIDGFEEYAPQRIRVNFNLTDPLIDAILLLIEQKITTNNLLDLCENLPDNNNNNVFFKSEEQRTLFSETVLDDVKKMYTEAQQHDLSSLSLTTHRLKGAFAMLNISVGKTLCEQLEQAIQQKDMTKTNSLISQIDCFVNKLLQLGSQ